MFTPAVGASIIKMCLSSRGFAIAVHSGAAVCAEQLTGQDVVFAPMLLQVHFFVLEHHILHLIKSFLVDQSGASSRNPDNFGRIFGCMVVAGAVPFAFGRTVEGVYPNVLFVAQQFKER